MLYSSGSSLPPRLPGLSQVLKSLYKNSSDEEESPRYTIVALSYRGFWTSEGRLSEWGILLDAAAALEWVSATFPPDTLLVLWGQSLGAGVAVKAAAAHGSNHPVQKSMKSGEHLVTEVQKLEISGLILETPFTSVKDMLAAIYPQTWLPYRHLWPFLRSHWDSRQALNQIAKLKRRPKVLVLQAGGDELVPREHGEELEELCKDHHIDIERLVINGALHHEIISKPRGRAAIAKFVKDIGEQD